MLKPTYKPTIDSRLVRAKPLVERKGLFLSILDNKSEEVLSFRP